LQRRTRTIPVAEIIGPAVETNSIKQTRNLIHWKVPFSPVLVTTKNLVGRASSEVERVVGISWDKGEIGSDEEVDGLGMR